MSVVMNENTNRCEKLVNESHIYFADDAHDSPLNDRSEGVSPHSYYSYAEIPQYASAEVIHYGREPFIEDDEDDVAPSATPPTIAHHINNSNRKAVAAVATVSTYSSGASHSTARTLFGAPHEPQILLQQKHQHAASSATAVSSTAMEYSAESSHNRMLKGIQPSASTAQDATHLYSLSVLSPLQEESTEVCVIPRVDIADLTNTTKVIGQGGDRGSLVYCTMRRRSSGVIAQEAHKVYPQKVVPENELSFIQTALKWSKSLRCTKGDDEPDDSAAILQIFGALTPPASHLADERLCYGIQHLLIPNAVTTQHDCDCGLLMPLFKCSLKQYMLARSRMVELKTTLYQGEEENDSSSMLKRQCYAPVEGLQVITAISFQLLQAIVVLNHHLPHLVNDRACSGYTHNDIHLDNILLSDTGVVALCDFELVEHLPIVGGIHVPQKRLPPYGRRSPHGLFSTSSDTWSFGLVILNLLTGVDPLFSSERVMDDFGEGPLLQAWCAALPDVNVLDWSSNIEAHALALLHRQDPSGDFAEAAQPLLEVCSKCLVNREGASPASALELCDLPAFKELRRDPILAEATVLGWMKSTP